MSLMNVMSVTLVLLILGAGVALFFGTRASDASEVTFTLPMPVFQEFVAEADAMNDQSSSYDIASAE